MEDALKKHSYNGAAPVPFKTYVEAIKAQTMKNVMVTRRNIRKAFSDLVISEAALNEIGPAVNSAASVFLFGFPGNGKTSVAERITRLMGDSIFIPYAVEVNGQRYEGRNVVLASGSYARSLPGLDIEGQRVITSDHALLMDYVPGSVVVLGGGVIGVEFASVWRSFVPGFDVNSLSNASDAFVPVTEPATVPRAPSRDAAGMKSGIVDGHPPATNSLRPLNFPVRSRAEPIFA